jgi:hypothetical protein
VESTVVFTTADGVPHTLYGSRVCRASLSALDQNNLIVDYKGYGDVPAKTVFQFPSFQIASTVGHALLKARDDAAVPSKPPAPDGLMIIFRTEDGVGHRLLISQIRSVVTTLLNRRTLSVRWRDPAMTECSYYMFAHEDEARWVEETIRNAMDTTPAPAAKAPPSALLTFRAADEVTTFYARDVASVRIFNLSGVPRLVVHLKDDRVMGWGRQSMDTAMADHDLIVRAMEEHHA